MSTTLQSECIYWSQQDRDGVTREIVIPLSRKAFEFALESRSDMSPEGKLIEKGKFESGYKNSVATLLFDRYPQKRVLIGEFAEAVSIYANYNNVSINTVRGYINNFRTLLGMKSVFKSFKTADESDVREVMNEAERCGFSGIAKLMKTCISYHSKQKNKHLLLQIASRRILSKYVPKTRNLDVIVLKKIHSKILSKIEEIKSVYLRFEEYEQELSKIDYFCKENVAKTFLVAKETRGTSGGNAVRRIFRGIVDYSNADELLELSKNGVDLFNFESEKSVYFFIKTLASKGDFKEDSIYEIRTKAMCEYWDCKKNSIIYNTIAMLCPSAIEHFSRILKFLRPSSELIAPFLAQIIFETGVNAEVLINARKDSLKTKKIDQTETFVFSGYKARAKRELDVLIPIDKNNILYENFTVLLKMMDLLKECEKFKINSKIAPLLFKNHYNSGKLKQNRVAVINEFIQGVASELGESTVRLVVRDLRKNFLTLNALEGANPEEIRTIAQHKSVQTQKHYINNQSTREEKFQRISDLQQEILNFSLNVFSNQIEFNLLTKEETLTLAPPSSLIFDARVSFEKEHLGSLFSLWKYATRCGGSYYDRVAMRISGIFNEFDLDENSLALLEVEAEKYNDYIAQIEQQLIVSESELELGERK